MESFGRAFGRERVDRRITKEELEFEIRGYLSEQRFSGTGGGEVVAADAQIRPNLRFGASCLHSLGSGDLVPLWLALRAQDLNHADIEDVWLLLDLPECRKQKVLLRQPLPACAASRYGAENALWQRVYDVLACGSYPYEIA